MALYLLLLVPIGITVLLWIVIRYAYAHPDNLVCATIVDCWNDVLEQIAQEPDVVWLATLLGRRQPKLTALSDSPFEAQQRQKLGTTGVARTDQDADSEEVR
jgi:hypothetical protein